MYPVQPCLFGGALRVAHLKVSPAKKCEKARWYCHVKVEDGKRVDLSM
jgi:hypothetical protein